MNEDITGSIGLVGTGLMGSALAKRLLQQGVPLMVFNRTRSKAKALVPFGAFVCDTAQDLLSRADVIIEFLSDARAIEDVLFQGEASIWKSKTLIQMATIAPDESLRFQDIVIAAGGDYIECPVLGSVAQIESGRLLLLPAGEPDVVARHEALLRKMGILNPLFGPVPTAAAVKLAYNQIIASHITALSFAMGLAASYSADTDAVMAVLRQSALHCPMFDAKYPRLKEQRFDEPSFPLQHMLKDVRLAEEAASSRQVRVEHVQAMRSYFEQAMQKVLSDRDYSAVSKVIAPCLDREPNSARP